MKASQPQADDIRDRLRKDHDAALAELDALRREGDQLRAAAQLARVRQAWMIHALAEEAVVYRALEGAQAANEPQRADERFIEHELVGSLFDKLARVRVGSLEWHARLNVVRDLITRHLESENADLFGRLAAHFDAPELREMGRRFELARDKLTLLEEAKAA